MAGWERVWSDEQKDAIIAAYFVAGIHNMAQITRLAHAGELRFEGKTLPPYRNPSGLLIPSASVRDIIRTEEKRRKGKRHSDLVNKPAPEAHELLRRRLTSMLDHETLRIEHWQKMNPYKELDAEHVRRLGRALRELQSLPQAGERAKTPGTGPVAERDAGTTRDGVGGSILAAMRPGGIEAAQERTQPNGDRPEGRINTPERKTESTGDAASTMDNRDGATARQSAAEASNEAAEMSKEASKDSKDGGWRVEEERPGSWASTQIAHLRST